LLLGLVIDIKLLKVSLIFLFESERKLHGNWVLYAKVTKGQSFFGRGSKTVSFTQGHIDFRDVPKLMIAILDHW